MKLKDLTESELQAQMYMLQRKQLKKNETAGSFLLEDTFQGNLEDSDYNESDENGMRRRVEFRRRGTGRFNDESQTQIDINRILTHLAYYSLW